MSIEQYEYLDTSLHQMLLIIRQSVAEEQDRPDTPVPPIQQVVTQERTGRRGRPRIEINQPLLQLSLTLRNPAQIAPVIGASTRTIARRAVEYGLRPLQPPVAIRSQDENGAIITTYPGRRASHYLSDDELEGMMSEALTLFPNFGRKMLQGYFKGKGHKVPIDRVRQAFERVNGARAEFGQRRIERRTYKVAGPNSLWHHDGHHSE